MAAGEKSGWVREGGDGERGGEEKEGREGSIANG